MSLLLSIICWCHESLSASMQPSRVSKHVIAHAAPSSHKHDSLSSSSLLSSLHCGPKNVTCFYFTVVSTNVDQFLQYVDILLINAWMDGWIDRWIWHVVYRVNLLHNLVTRLTCLLLLYYLGENWCLHLPAWQCARIACTCLRIALILIQFTVKYWAWCRIQWIRCELKTWPIDARCKALSTVLLMNGVRDFRPLWMKKEASWTLAVISRLKCTTTVYTN